MAAYGPEVIAALRVVLDDLAHGRLTGKALGVRHVSGDLTGLASVKFDLPDSPTRRFRLVYAELDASTRGLLAVGVRDEHAIYRLASERLEAGKTLGEGSE
ncbi:MAG: hypothetical protein ACRDY3_10870 [Acidimicrobiales bacterium]